MKTTTNQPYTFILTISPAPAPHDDENEQDCSCCYCQERREWKLMTPEQRRQRYTELFLPY